MSKNIKCILKISPMSGTEVYGALRQMKQMGTRGLNGTDGKIIRIFVPVITETLACICDLCIDKSHFPS